MDKVGLREANIHFARYVKKVKGGTEILLTDRGKPIAVISPISRKEEPLEERLRMLEKMGILRMASAGKLKLHKLMDLPGKGLSAIVCEGREERP